MLDNFLAPYAIDDALQARAYEMASPAQRACLKNAIAFHSLMGEGPSQSSFEQQFRPKGYSLTKHIKPIPWLICFCSAEYISAARLIAALMPACMAQVPRIFVVHLTNQPAMPLLLALELLGIEQNFGINHSILPKLENILIPMMNEGEAGRLLFLGDDVAFRDLQQKAKDSRVSIWEDFIPPRIYSNIAKAENDLLHWAHGDAQFCKQLDPNIHAVYGDFDEQQCSNLLVQQWSKGMEACYTHEQLKLGFFQNTFLKAKNLIHE